MGMWRTVRDCASGYGLGDSEYISCGVRAGRSSKVLQSHSEGGGSLIILRSLLTQRALKKRLATNKINFCSNATSDKAWGWSIKCTYLVNRAQQ